MLDNSSASRLLEETAQVNEVRDGLLIVETESRSGCNHCSSNSCTTSVVAKLFGVKRNRLVLQNSIDARPGDRVLIGIPDQLLVRASLSAYLLPLVVMLLVTALGDQAGIDELFLSLLALMGLAVGFLTVRWISRNGNSQDYQPRLLGIVATDYPRVEMPTFNQELEQ